MTLPKIDTPLFNITLPLSKKKCKFRPFLLKEEKILLMAKQSNDSSEIIEAIKQIIRNCCFDESLDVDKLPILDIEYFFLKLRAKSINDIVEFIITDPDDNQEYKLSVDLDKVEVLLDGTHNNKIIFSENLGIVMKYPTFSVFEKIKDFDENNPEHQLASIRLCIEHIFDENNVYPATDYSEEELDNWLLSLTKEYFEKIMAFFETMPKLSIDIEYKNSLGTKKQEKIEGISSFFQLG